MPAAGRIFVAILAGLDSVGSALMDPGENEMTYTCPMHPEVQQDHPGDCPKCGMALEPI